LAGGKPKLHGIQGIGTGFVTKNYNATVVDEIIHVSTQVLSKLPKLLHAKKAFCGGFPVELMFLLHFSLGYEMNLKTKS